MTNKHALKLVTVLIGAIAVLAAMLYRGPWAHADDEPGVGSLVGQPLELGYTPGEIAEQLHQGDRRYSEFPDPNDRLG